MIHATIASMLPQLAIRADALTKSFGTVHALSGIDLLVPTGTVYGLLGPNGAGKTTAVRIFSSLLRPDGGRAVVAGFDVVRQPDELRMVIGLSGQFAAVDENLTGRENLWMFGRLYHSVVSRRSAGRRSSWTSSSCWTRVTGSSRRTRVA